LQSTHCHWCHILTITRREIWSLQSPCQIITIYVNVFHSVNTQRRNQTCTYKQPLLKMWRFLLSIFWDTKPLFWLTFSLNFGHF
jgi:hypothetical protein